MIEREWREASDMRQSTLSVALVLCAAAALRFYKLGAGIPYAIGVDEPEIVNRAVGMMRSGQFNPHFFDYPGLYLYIQLAVAVLRFMFGAIRGQWDNLADLTNADYYLWGRAVTATMGTATVAIVYAIGLRWGTRPALLAAALMAVMPLHVRESHYVLTDVPSTFFVALTFLLTLRAHERQSARAFAWSGAVAGLAAATKYPGGLALVLPLVAVAMAPGIQPSRRWTAVYVVAASAGAFLLAAPYTLLDLPAFLNGYAHLSSSYSSAPLGEPRWLIYFKHLRNNLQWPAMLLILGGAVLAIVRAVSGPGRVRWTLVVLFPLLFFAFVSRQTLLFARYLMPLVPFICLLAGIAVVSGVSLLRRFSIPRALRTALIAGLTVATLLPATIRSINFDRTLARTSTPGLAYAWLWANAPHDARVVVEPGSPLLTHAPFRSETVRQLRQFSYSEYQARGVDYLIASSQCYDIYLKDPASYPAESSDYQQLFAQAEEVARFTASANHPGPELRILKVRR